MTDPERMLIDIGFYSQIIGDAKRTILCPPELLEDIRRLVDAHDLAGIYTVRSSPVCVDKLFVLDEQAMEASFQQAAQRAPMFRRFG